MFTETAEALKGVTDLPIAALCGVFAVLSQTRRKERGKALLFALVCVSALLGAAAHIFVLPQAALDIMWTVLYPCLYISAEMFCELFVHKLKDADGAVKLFRLSLPLFLLGSVILMLCGIGADIYVFVAYGVLCFAVSLIKLQKSEARPKTHCILLLILLTALLFQALKSVIPLGVVWAHCGIMASLCFVYRI